MAAPAEEVHLEKRPTHLEKQREAPHINREDIAVRKTIAMQEYEQRLDRAQDEWRTPIEFYGRVVDEVGNPIQGAQIKFTCNDLSTNGTSSYSADSDGQGSFSISGIKGKLLTARVSKSGYYTSRSDNDSFYYAGQDVNFVPDANRPVVFHLRRNGKLEPLIAVTGSTSIPRDGKPVGLSLTQAKAVSEESAELVIQCWTDDVGKRPGQRFDWRCRLTVPGGGLQEITEEFPFLAPETGYQMSTEINMRASLGNEWRDKAARSYFLKLGNGDYARIEFEMIPYGEHFALLQSYLNPSGSRNLESDVNVHFTRLSK
ncbi:MAG: hypothetical protein C5B50_15315 [Verrucomicrobia bacterium]|nr:MAG: hypothetical protein C5B50_15315 [Verrucomicrobiota bacterium]